MQILKKHILIFLLIIPNIAAGSLRLVYTDCFQEKDFTFLIPAIEDVQKALYKNQARLASVIRELYGDFGDSLLLNEANLAFKRLKRQYPHINLKLSKETGKLTEISMETRRNMPYPRINFNFSMGTGKLTEISMEMNGRIDDFSAFHKFLMQNFERIMYRFVCKYHEIYITMPHDFLFDKDKYKNIYDCYFQYYARVFKDYGIVPQEQMPFLRSWFLIPESIKTGKELLDYICSFEDCPIKTNEDFGVFREDYVK